MKIRPLHRADAPALQDFVRGLSPQTRQERYFYAMRELPAREVERVTQPREGRDASLGVFEGGRLVAVADYAGAAGAAEFGLVVADDWQGRGIGRELIERLSAHARRHGLAGMHGVVRAGNRAMLRLAAHLGFRVAHDPDPALLRVEQKW
jgi:acetyltransferase